MPPPARPPASKGPDGATNADMEARQQSTPPRLMHFPHCRLEITTFPNPSATPTTTANGSSTPPPLPLSDSNCKIEQVALPGPLVRTLLSRFESEVPAAAAAPRRRQPSPPPSQLSTVTSSSPPTSLPPPLASSSSSSAAAAASALPPPAARKRERRIRIQRHFDDDADWVFSRCLLADFTGLREDEADALSARGRLCCWASVVLRPLEDDESESVGFGLGERDGEGDGEGDGDEEDGEEGLWELGFVVHRVGVRDPESGWCECF